MPIILTIILFLLSIGIPIYSAISKARILKKDEEAEVEFEESLKKTFINKDEKE